MFVLWGSLGILRQMAVASEQVCFFCGFKSFLVAFRLQYLESGPSQNDNPSDGLFCARGSFLLVKSYKFPMWSFYAEVLVPSKWVITTSLVRKKIRSRVWVC